MTSCPMPINFNKWIDENRHLLTPPVSNRLVFDANTGFYIMVVGGPNARKDFHYNTGPEFFYQVEGDMLLKTYEQGKINDIPIGQGEIFMLPPKIPHSPQRFKDTIGLVIEQKRPEGYEDGLQWYCDQCEKLLYEEYFILKNIEQDFPPVFDRFFSSLEHRTCQSCGFIVNADEELVCN